MLRVGLTGFYDMMAVVLKCFQEFGESKDEMKD